MILFKEKICEAPDEKLVILVSKGNKEAFAELMNRHLTPVFRLSYGMVQDKERAEDIAQETFITLWEKATQYTPTGKLRSWLFRIARNKTIDVLRSNKPQINIEHENVEDTKKTPYEEALTNERERLVTYHINQLADRQREAITLVHLLEMSQAETAEIMGTSVDALESLLRRARTKLKNSLGSFEELNYEE